MDDKKELKKANGDVYFEAYRVAGNSYIHANWIGIQTLESVVMGGNVVLDMLRERPSRGLLNCNRELVGPWEVGVPYMINKWVPAATHLGLRYFAHVLSPGIFGQRSYELFKEQMKASTHSLLHLKAFELEEPAQAWLLLHLL